MDVHDGSKDNCSNNKLAPIPVRKPKSFDAKNAPSTAFAMIPDATFNANAGAAFRATCWTAISDEIKPGPKNVTEYVTAPITKDVIAPNVNIDLNVARTCGPSFRSIKAGNCV